MPNKKKEGGGSENFVTLAIRKLPPKFIFILFTLGLILLSGVIGLAVYQGSGVDLLGIKITPSPGNGSPSVATVIPTVRLNISFDPDEVNPRDPDLQVMAYKQPINGDPVPLPVRKGVEQGGIYVDLEPPDMETPFFVVIQSPNGTWKTEDISLKNSYPMAYKISN